MNAWNTLERPDHRKYRLLREALVDVRALVPGDVGPDGRPIEATPPETGAKAGAGLALDGAANVAVLCAGAAIVLIAAAAEGLQVVAQGLA